MSGRSLEFIFQPKAIAIVGASEAKQKVGYAVMNNCITSGYKGKIYPINNRATEILGHKCYKSVLDVEGEIDVAVICVPARFVVSVMEQVGKKKIPGAVIITAGFKEIGGEGVVLENKISEICKKNNIRCIGPNCLGFISPSLNASFASLHPPKGNISMISQSGAMLTAILDWSQTSSVGFSNFVSIGNKCDLDEIDLIKDCGQDPNTKIIICYIESVTNGEKFLKVLPEVTKQKPVIILKSGVSEAGSRAASSHTGALAQNDVMFTSAFEKTGVIRAERMEELFDMARAFSCVEKLNGKKFGIVTNAGGPSIVATDAFEKLGVQLTKIDEKTIAEFKKTLPAESALLNPIDIIGDADPKRYEDALRALFKMSDEECAGALVLVTPQSQTNCPEVARVLLRMKEEFPSKIIVSSFMGGVSMEEPAKILKGKIANFPFPEPAVGALKELVKYKEFQEKFAEEEKKERKPAVTLTEEQKKRVKEIFAQCRSEKRDVLYSYETSEIFGLYGVKHPKTKIATKPEEVEAAANGVGYPMVLKIVSPDILHKSDCGGVLIGVKNLEEAKKGFTTVLENAKKNGPKGASITGVEFQEMVDYKAYEKVSEIIVGISRDATFGALLMVGHGGKYANYFKDVSFDMVHNYDAEAAMKQVKKTKIFKILEGVRGEKPSAIGELADVMARVGTLATDFTEVSELDVNPLLVFTEKEGVNAIDIKIKISL